tara:strand:+ start:371 stop:1468 length:1098 start_codon:yes stop_codon:yes gene_type:complete
LPRAGIFSSTNDTACCRVRFTQTHTFSATQHEVKKLLWHRADYYATLGLHRSASEDQIKRAYRKLALKYHPDKNTGNEDAAHRFTEIGNAYEVLSNKEKRQIYDRLGEEGVQQHAQNNRGSSGSQDIFSTFFGGNFGSFGAGREAETLKGDPIGIDLEVSLKDLYLGQILRLGRDKSVVKPAKGVRKCNCKQHMVTRQVGPGMFQQYAKEECEECPNVKMMRDFESLNVEIEPGMPDRHVIHFFEEGEPIIDGESGDMRLYVTAAKDHKFTREGDDLHMTHRIHLVHALTGFQHNFTHVDGRIVELARSSITFPGHTDVISFEGMPMYGSNGKFGNLVITYEVDFPEFLDDEQKVQVRTIFQRHS